MPMHFDVFQMANLALKWPRVVTFDLNATCIFAAPIAAYLKRIESSRVSENDMHATKPYHFPKVFERHIFAPKLTPVHGPIVAVNLKTIPSLGPRASRAR
jgi:hypothetical protein